MHSSVPVFVVLLGFASSARAQSLSFGNCPSLETVTNFDLTRYAGTWYESWKNQKYYRIVDFGLKCATETYTIVNDHSMVVNKTGFFSFGNRRFSQRGTARLLNKSSGRGVLGFSYPALTFSPQDAPYWVLDTDYTNYSVVWSCSTYRFMNLKIFWILTRDPFPDDAIIRKAFEVLDRNGISRSTLSRTNQKNCPR